MSPPVALASSLPLPLVLLVALALIPACSGRLSSGRASLHAHMLRVRDFPCREPQPRAVNVRSLTSVRGDESYMPLVTVLHRCDAGSGCCGGVDTECGPYEEEQVPLTFFVRYHVKPERPATYVTVWATNHTRCQCDEVIPK